MLKISSLNLNGIRAAHRRGLVDWIEQNDPDIVCFQELRAHEHQMPGPVRDLDYHAFYHTAEKKGYSGVAVFTKQHPLSVEYGIGVDWIDREGRIIKTEFEELIVFSVYAPSGTTGDERQNLKMEFLDHFLPFAESYLDAEKPVLFCGDFNICHTEIDIHNPRQNANTSGFLPEEREWVSRLLETGYEDIYRQLHEGETGLYSWWSYRAAAKKRNKGWRIDYHIASPDLLHHAENAVIEKEWDLSDHAPVTITYAI